MREEKVICLQCPLACEITVLIDSNDEIIEYKGNNCSRGEFYARQEVICPKRVLTTTVALQTQDIQHPVLPVQTKGLIPKAMLFDAMKVLSTITVKAPVYYDEIVVHNILDTGIDVVSTFEVLE